MNNKIRIFLIIMTFFYQAFILEAKCEDPLHISTETEDIALTDDINIAKAQVLKYPDNPEAHFNLAIALSHTSLVEEAIKELRKTKKLIRKTGGVVIIDNKINEYKEMLKNHETNPTLNNIRYRLAFSHYLKAYLISKDIKKNEESKSKKSDKNSSSINLFNKALLISEKNPLIKENLDLSTSYFKELLKLNPGDTWAKVYYAFILAEQMDEITKARELWTEVTKQDPNNPAPYFFLGELHIKEGKLKEGITEISQALLLRSLGH